jgi:arylsulfatase A-like enzyme
MRRMLNRLITFLVVPCLLVACVAPEVAQQAAETAKPTAAPASRQAPGAKPDVIICLIDTLRKDHLGCYYYPLDTSPNIDALAKEGVIFRDLVPMSSWTRPSIATMLTGTMDYTHHALSMEDHLREGLPSLARTLRDAGWFTRSIVTNPAVGGTFGFGRDFESHTDVGAGRPVVTAREDLEAVELALEAIAQAGEKPLFMYLHLMAPHREYQPPAEFRDLFMPETFVGTRPQVRVQKELALYDAEIRFADHSFGRVVRALKDAGRYDNAIIVVLSDHGEQFMEHGELAHANSMYGEELNVPFVLKLPGNAHAGFEVGTLVQMADVAPTLLDVLGLRAEGMDGRSLMPLVALEGSFEPRPAFARLRFSQRHLFMARAGSLKLIRNVARGEEFWFDLNTDPQELMPMLSMPEGAEGIRAAAEEFAARPVPAMGAASPPLTEEQRKDLEAMGYL